MNDEQGIEALQKAMKEFKNWGIVFWNTETIGGYEHGYEQLKEYAMMSNTDADTALLSVDAIISIMIEKRCCEQVKTNA